MNNIENGKENVSNKQQLKRRTQPKASKGHQNHASGGGLERTPRYSVNHVLHYLISVLLNFYKTTQNKQKNIVNEYFYSN